MHYFLGIEVERKSSGDLLLTQRKYAQDILSKVRMSNCKHVATPMALAEKMIQGDGEFFLIFYISLPVFKINRQ